MKITTITLLAASSVAVSVAFAAPAAAVAPLAPSAEVQTVPNSPPQVATAVPAQPTTAPMAKSQPAAPVVAQAPTQTPANTTNVQEPGISMSANPAPIQTADATDAMQAARSPAEDINSSTMGPQGADTPMGPTAMNNLPANIGNADDYSSGDSMSGTADQASGVDY